MNDDITNKCEILGKCGIDSGCRGNFQNRWRDPPRGDITRCQGYKFRVYLHPALERICNWLWPNISLICHRDKQNSEFATSSRGVENTYLDVVLPRSIP